MTNKGGTGPGWLTGPFDAIQNDVDFGPVDGVITDDWPVLGYGGLFDALGI